MLDNIQNYYFTIIHNNISYTVMISPYIAYLKSGFQTDNIHKDVIGLTLHILIRSCGDWIVILEKKANFPWEVSNWEF